MDEPLPVLTTPNRKPLILVAATLLFILLAMVTSWLIFLPQRIASGFRTELQNKSGLTLDLTGPARLRFDYGLVIGLEDVTLNQQGEQGVALLSADRISLPLTFGSLFSVAGAPKELLFENPVLTIAPDAGAQLALAANGKVDGGGAIRNDKSLTIIIANGTFKMRSGAGGLGIVATDVNGQVNWRSDEGLVASLNGLLNGQSTQFNVSVDDGWRVLAEGSPAEISLTTANNQLAFSGRLKAAENWQLDGRVQGRGPSLQNFSAWLALPLNGFAASGKFDLDSALSLSGDVASLTDVKLSLGAMQASGNVVLTQATPRPLLDVAMDFDFLDLAVYQQSTTEGLSQVPSLTKGWSEAPLAFADLAALDAKLSLQAKHLKLGGLTAGLSTLDITLKNQKLEGVIKAENVEGGVVTTNFNIDGQSSEPKMALELKTRGVNAHRFLGATTGFTALEGDTDIDALLQAEGSHVAGLISTLKGQAKLSLKDGKLHGLALVKTLHDVAKGWELADQALTSVSDIIIDVAIEEGIAQLQKAEISEGPLTIAAQGTVDLLRQHMDVRVKPKISTGSSAIKLPVEVNISGPWQAPNISPDVDGRGLKPALRLLDKAVDGDDLEKLGKKAKKSFKKLFGN